MALKANNVLIKSIDIGAKEWVAKTWNGLTNISGSNVWSDGENIYYSYDEEQYKLNKSTSTWTTKTWSGLTSFKGRNIWSDGENIYYSSNSMQYYLNQALATPTWQTKTWSGLTSFDGNNVWSDGENIYYSYDAEQYQLDKATSTWTTKTWSGLTSFYGTHIWTDGENIYFSGGTPQYKLNKSTSTWTTKTWSGLTSFYGSEIWTDGKNIYYSYSSTQCYLNQATSQWLSQEWRGITNFSVFYGFSIWNDNEGAIYFSSGETQYELVSPIHYLYKGDTCQWVKPYTITIKVTGTPNANIKVIIYRSSNAKGQEPSAVYDSSGGESSYVINVASTAADGQQIVGYYGDTLYVKAQSYSSGSYHYNIYGQSYTVTGDGQLSVNVSYSVSCSSCNTSARKNICNTRCNTNLKHIGICSGTSTTSGICEF